MCFYFQQSKTAIELEKRFNAKIESFHSPISKDYNGFTNPHTPIITNQNPNIIQYFQWGLIPTWAKTKEIQKNTLNARIETLQDKTSFKNLLSERCLIIATGFYEWQWLDAKGKQKQKYVITIENNELFAFAGLWNTWTDKETGEISNTYTIITTEANELMSKIHNTKKRMPLILNSNEEQQWLKGASPIHYPTLFPTKI